MSRVSLQVWGGGRTFQAEGTVSAEVLRGLCLSCLKSRELSGVTGAVWVRWENRRQ